MSVFPKLFSISAVAAISLWLPATAYSQSYLELFYGLQSSQRISTVSVRDELSREVLGTFSDNSTIQGPTSPAYFDFTASPAPVYPGQSIQLSLSPKYFRRSGDFDLWQVSADLNDDGIFSGSERVLAFKSNTSATALINLPRGIVAKSTRVRVSVAYASFFSAIPAATSSARGPISGAVFDIALQPVGTSITPDYRVVGNYSKLGRLVAGAKVTLSLSDASRGTLSTRTDSNGSFSFDLVAPVGEPYYLSLFEPITEFPVTKTSGTFGTSTLIKQRFSR